MQPNFLLRDFWFECQNITSANIRKVFDMNLLFAQHFSYFYVTFFITLLREDVENAYI